MRRASVRVTRAGRHAKRGADGAARAHNKMWAAALVSARAIVQRRPDLLRCGGQGGGASSWDARFELECGRL